MKVIFFILDYANFIVNDGKIADPPVLSKTYFIFALLLFCKDTFRKYFKIRYNTQAKFEINREEGLNPIKQDLENGEPRCHPEIVKLQCIIHVKAIFFVCQSHIFLQSWSVQLQHFKLVFVFTYMRYFPCEIPILILEGFFRTFSHGTGTLATMGLFHRPGRILITLTPGLACTETRLLYGNICIAVLHVDFLLIYETSIYIQGRISTTSKRS